MAEKSKIEWTDATWTPIRARVHDIQNDGSGRERIGWHCEHVSEGCRNCYAEAINIRLGTGRDYKPGELFREEKRGYINGEVKLFLDEKMLLAPLRWKRPRKIFVGSMTDIFASFVNDEWIDRIFAVMALCPQHTFQVLTKRPERMRKYLEANGEACERILAQALQLPIPDPCAAFVGDGDGGVEGLASWPLPNVWLGVSVEDQATADERIPLLLDTPAAKRFISAEPLLGPINLDALPFPKSCDCEDDAPQIDVLQGTVYCAGCCEGPEALDVAVLDWVIVGGESGPNARPMHPDWVRSFRDHCAAAVVPFFFKQWGEYLPVGQCLPGFGVVHGATAVCVGRMKLHYGGTSKEPPQLAFAERGVEVTSTVDDSFTFRVGKKAAGHLLDGREHSEFPA